MDKESKESKEIKENTKKIRPLKILDILNMDSDEDKPITTPELLKRLEEEGIECTRQTLYSDIKLLQDCGYDIGVKRGNANEYYITDRSFSIPELHILMDAVQAATFITPRKTKELVYKIASLGGSYKAEILKSNNVQFNSVKHTNESIYYNVNEIEQAIMSKKKISFKYFDYNEKKEKVYRGGGKIYKENPYATIYSDDNYYLLSYNEYWKRLTHYRVDKMDEVCALDEAVIPKGNLDISKHKASVFGMFIGEEATVVIEIDKKLIDVVMDRFGQGVKFTPADEDRVRFKADVQVSSRFISWVSSFGTEMKVIGPQSVINNIRDSALEILGMYGKPEGASFDEDAKARKDKMDISRSWVALAEQSRAAQTVAAAAYSAAKAAASTAAADVSADVPADVSADASATQDDADRPSEPAGGQDVPQEVEK